MAEKRFPIQQLSLSQIEEANDMASTTVKSAEDILGFEYDWLACDEDGHVALFSTAGAGYAPSEFLQDTEAHAVAIHAILEGPGTTTARFAPTVAPDLENTWKSAAEHGLFAFDCDPNGGPYLLIAAPVVPIAVADLPRSAVDAVSRIKLRLRFSGQTTVTETALRDRT